MSFLLFFGCFSPLGVDRKKWSSILVRDNTAGRRIIASVEVGLLDVISSLSEGVIGSMLTSTPVHEYMRIWNAWTGVV